MCDKKVLSKSPFNSSQNNKIVKTCRDLSRENYRKWDSTTDHKDKVAFLVLGLNQNKFANFSVYLK